MGLVAIPVLATYILGCVSLADDPDVAAYARTKGGTVSAVTKGGSTSKSTSTGVTNLYVSLQGNDAWSGTLMTPNPARTDGPVASLTRARDILRAMKQTKTLGAKGAVVNVLPGSYRLGASFELTDADSGTEKAPIVYRGTQPGSVELLGGQVLSNFRPVSTPSVTNRFPASVRSQIVEADLAAAGVTDVGTRHREGFNGPRVPEVAELFFEGRAMTVAQWPNDGWARTAAGTPPSGWSFLFAGTRPSGWAWENEVWVHGFFAWDWADFYERVTTTDVSRGLARTAVQPPYGFRPGARFVFLNVLEELDTPGEYYVDKLRRKVYFLPPQAESDGRVVISTLTAPLVSLNRASHLRFESLSLRHSRGTAVTLSGCDNVQINGCNVTGMGLNGIEADNVSRLVVQSTDIGDIGHSGILVSGGDRTKLTSGQNSILNCHIAATGRISYTLDAAIVLNGVGTTVKNCTIHDLPQQAIRLYGNNHVVEGNEIYRTCLQTSDSAAIYMGRNFTEQGNAFRNNYFHDIVPAIEKNSTPGDSNTYAVAAVMLDDFASGTTVYGNIMRNVDVGVLVGGGRDNTVQNNAFLDCRLGVQLDARGLDWASGSFTDPNSEVLRNIRDSAYLTAPYRKAYPNLAKLLQDNPDTPKRNVLRSNVAYLGGWAWKAANYPAAYNQEMNNVVGVDPGFTNLAALVLSPKTKSAAAKAGFKAISASTSGLKVDAYRKTLPTAGALPNP